MWCSVDLCHWNRRRSLNKVARLSIHQLFVTFPSTSSGPSTISLLEVFAVIFGIVSVFLSTRQNIWSWPTAIVNVTLYSLVFYGAKLYADMGLQVVYLILSVYGWYQWKYGGNNRTELHVTRAPARLMAIAALTAVVFAAFLGAILSRTTDAALPWLDSATTSTSLVAQFMMTRKILENWVIWAAVDVVYVGMFIYKELYLTAGLYAAFFVLAVAGYRQWKRALLARGAAPGRVVPA